MSVLSLSLSSKFKPYSGQDDYYQTLLFLLMVAAVVIFAGIGLRDPWPADEPRFVEVAREMVESGNWFFPMRGGEVYPDKPPVFMWIIAAFYWLTGSLKLSFMLPNAIVSLLTLVCCYDICAKIWNVKVAHNSALLLLIVPQFMIQAKAVQIDAMVTAWITIAMYGMLRHFFVKTSWAWYCVAWGFMGLGIITKGVGFLPAFLMLPILFLHFTGRYRFESQVSWKLLFGPVIMYAVVACWLIPMLSLVGSSHNPDLIAYKENILFTQTQERYTNSLGHMKPWYYYLVSVIPVLWFPLYFAFFNKSIWRQIRQSPVLLSLIVWSVLVVIFFSISPGKRGVYILPVLPMVTIIVGYFLAQQSWQKWIDTVIRALSFAIIPLAMVATVMALLHAKILTQEVGDKTGLYALFFAAVGIIWGITLWKNRNKSALYGYGLALLFTWILYSFAGYPLLNTTRTPARQLMQQVQDKIGPNAELGLTRFKEQFLLFSPIPLTHFSYLASASEQDRNAWQWMKEKPNRYILTYQRNIECFDMNKAIELGTAHRKDWVLLNQESLLGSCQPPIKVERYHLNISSPYA